MVGKMINYMSTLTFGYLDPIFEQIQTTSAGAGLTKDNTLYSACDVMNNSDNQETKEFSERLANGMLKSLLSILLLSVIKIFKRLVSNYFARTFIEKQKRKSEKIKARFGLIGDIAETADKARRYAAAASTLSSIIGNTKV
jgi:hypothetical protein